MALRVVFMGTPEFAVPTLTKIVEAGHDVVAVYTREPKAAGRGMAEQPSPIHEAARGFGIPLVMPRTLKIPAVETLFAEHRADAAVVVAYGLILPGAILRAPIHGCLNLHASLLPRWRGAAPIERAIIAGDAETGVMAMRMEEGLDTGPICLAERTPISENETAGELRARLASIGAELMVTALKRLEDGALECAPQPETGVTYAAKIQKSETRIDWQRQASELHNQIRGLSPARGAWCEVPRGASNERIKILRTERAAGSGLPGTILNLDPLIVACGTDALALIELQRAGKKPAAAAEFLRGARLRSGSMLA
jgi:methionyl-tRNA formyltransferase